MGGTSTDVARFDGDYEYRYEHRVGDARAGRSGAGHRDRRRRRRVDLLARRRAAARRAAERRRQPGTGLLRRGRPADADRRQPAARPARPRPLRDPDRARGRERRVWTSCSTSWSGAPASARDRARCSRACSTIANETMADAIRRISLRRGYDPTEYALVAFGGAGGQHACGVAVVPGHSHGARAARRRAAQRARPGPRRARALRRAPGARAARATCAPRSPALDRRAGRAGRATRSRPPASRRGSVARAPPHPAPALRRPGRDAWRSTGEPAATITAAFETALRRALRPPPREPRGRAGVDPRRGLVAARARTGRPTSTRADRRATGASARLLRATLGRTCRPSTATRCGPGATLRRARRWSSSGTARRWSSRAGGPRCDGDGALLLERGAADAARRRVAAARGDPAGAVHAALHHASSRRWASGSSAPRSRPTSRSGSTSPARCSTRTASWWSTPRTSRCTSARSACACAGWRRRSRCGPATSS